MGPLSLLHTDKQPPNCLNRRDLVTIHNLTNRLQARKVTVSPVRWVDILSKLVTQDNNLAQAILDNNLAQAILDNNQLQVIHRRNRQEVTPTSHRPAIQISRHNNNLVASHTRVHLSLQLQLAIPTYLQLLVINNKHQAVVQNNRRGRRPHHSTQIGKRTRRMPEANHN